jgi:Pectate lyase superfamily protein
MWWRLQRRVVLCALGALLISVALGPSALADVIDRVSVKDHGAMGDGSADDTVAILAAIDEAKVAGKAVYFPPGTYRITSSLVLDSTHGGFARGLIGEGLDSKIISNLPIPLITIDTSAGRIDGITITNLKLINAGPSNSDDIGILLKDTTSTPHFLNNSVFSNLHFYGSTYGIRNQRLNTTGAQGLHDWNLYTTMTFTNYGAKLLQYGIKFDNGGGGTGNVFTNMTMICATTCIEMGHPTNHAETVGDIIFSNLQMGSSDGGATGIKLIGGTYGERVSVVSSQFDADVTVALDFTNMRNFSAVGNNWGGGTTVQFNNCVNYLVDGQGRGDTTPVLELSSQDPSVKPNLLLRSGMNDRTPRINFTGPWYVSNPDQPWASIWSVSEDGGPSANARASLRFLTASGNPAALTEKAIITGTGNVGIGVAVPLYKLHVNGAAAATSWVTLSSARFKQDISAPLPSDRLADMGTAIGQLHLRNFSYLPDVEADSKLRPGLIAEEVPAAFRSADGSGVDMYQLLIHTLAAVQTLQARVTAQDQALTELESARAECTVEYGGPSPLPRALP